MSISVPKLSQSETAALVQATDPIRGWLNVHEVELLFTLGRITPGPILEMGCFQGKSTICFLRARAEAGITTSHVVVDLFENHLDVGKGDFEAQFRGNVEPWRGKTDLVIFRRSTFEVEPELQKITARAGLFHGIFVDADHSYAAVLKDAALAHRMLKPGGWVAFHDAVRWEGQTTVLSACADVAELNEYGFIKTAGSILLLEKPSPGAPLQPWKTDPRIQKQIAWNRSLIPKITGSIYGALMHSPLRKAVLGTVRRLQRAGLKRS